MSPSRGPSLRLQLPPLADRPRRFNSGAGDLKENFVYGRHGMEESKTTQPLPPSLRRRQAEVDEFHASVGDCGL